VISGAIEAGAFYVAIALAVYLIVLLVLDAWLGTIESDDDGMDS
jgi:hypothetical protein